MKRHDRGGASGHEVFEAGPVALARLRRFFMIAVCVVGSLLAAAAPAHAQSRGAVESGMRRAQALRVRVLELSPFDWPPCCDGSSTVPDYPPDGYYGADLTAECDDVMVGVTAVTALQDAVVYLIPSFYKPEVLSQHTSTFDWSAVYEVSDFPGLDASVTSSNYQQILGLCLRALDKLRYIGANLSLVSLAHRGIDVYPEGPLTGCTCEDAWSDIRSVIEGHYDWIEEDDPPPGGYIPEYFLGGLSGVEPDEWCPGGQLYVASGESVSNCRAKFRATFGDFRARVYVFLRVITIGDGTSDGAPVAANDDFLAKYARWTTASGTGSATTKYAGDNEPMGTFECEEEFNKGWIIQGDAASSEPGYEGVLEVLSLDTADSGTCMDGELANAPNVDTAAPPSLGPDVPVTCPPGAPGRGPGHNPSPRAGGDEGNGMRGPGVGGARGGGLPGMDLPLTPFEDRHYELMDPGADPTGPFPVVLALGTKYEAEIDVSVPTRAGTFAVARAYCSDPDLGGSSLVGKNWGMSAFQFLKEVTSGGTTTLTLDGWPLKYKLVYSETSSGSNKWSAGGPTLQVFERSTVAVGTATYATWRLSEPGGRKRSFYRHITSTEASTNGWTLPPAQYFGLLLQDEDADANITFYDYALFGGPTTSEAAKQARLVRIYTDGTPATGSSGAHIAFFWVLDSSSDDVQGKLKSIQVFQHLNDGVVEMTHRVDYTYKPPSSGDHADTGTAGDLIQVTKYDLVDSAPAGEPYRTQITQYRYHNGSTPASSEDERLTVAGAAHQLKSIFRPEQIEFVAQEMTQHGSSWSAQTALASAAVAIRGMADGAVVYTDGPVVVDYASKVVGYKSASPRKVDAEYLQSGCGCSGSAHGLKQVFTYVSPSGDPSTKVEEYVLASGSYSTLNDTRYYDMTMISSVPFLEVSALVGSDSRTWATKYTYSSSGELLKIISPSAITAYTPATSTTADSETISTSAGLVVGYAYNSDHYLTEIRLHEGDVTGSGWLSSFTPIVTLTYSTTTGRTYLVTKVERYRTTSSSPTASEIETVDYEYGIRSGTDSIAWVHRTEETETESENGPSSSTTIDTYRLYDSLGLLRWVRAEDNSLTFYKYDDFARLVQVTSNAHVGGPAGEDGDALDSADYADLPITGWGQTGGDTASPYMNELTSTFTFDSSARTRSSAASMAIDLTAAAPDEPPVKSYSVRELRTAADRAGVYYFAFVQLPFQLEPGGSFNGPAVVTLMDGAGATIQAQRFALSTSGYDPDNAAYTLSTELSRRTVQHSLSGLITSTHDYTDVSGGSYGAGSPEYATTGFAYDAIGRLASTKRFNGDSDHGSMTINIYDVVGRIVEVKVGTVDSGSSANVATTTKYFFDSPSDSTPSQGTGAGNLTHIIQYTGESGSGALSGSERKTAYRFDFRGRQTSVENAAAPHIAVEYDNLDRAVKRAVFSGASASVGSTTSSTRGLYTETLYNQRGLPYRRRLAIDPTDLGSGYLQTDTWYDVSGRVIAEAAPNSPGTKRTYDGLGRVAVEYRTDRGGDAAAGASGNHAAAAALVDDAVLEQVEYRFSNHGYLVLVTSRQRFHAYPTSGYATTGELTADNAISTFVGFCYDRADRRIRAVSFGTNTSSNEFDVGGTAPSTWPPSTPPDYDTTGYAAASITATAFDSRGLVESETDSKGRVTKHCYDDLGRRYAIVKDYDSSVSAFGVSWSSTNGRWTVAGLSTSTPDVNRVTTLVYDKLGHTVQQVAHVPGTSGEKIQVTKYDYSTGTTVGSVDTSTQSLVASYDLLVKVQHPDDSTGSAGSSASYWAQYSYNALGELRSITDQNGTIHVYRRDDLGRVNSDTVPTIATGIDGRIQRVGVAFDDFGRTQYVRSYTDTSGSTIANAVQFEYSPVWQLTKIRQDSNGDIQTSGGDTKVVEYAYGTAAAPSSGTGNGNYSRVSSMTYPDGSVLGYDYGASNGIDDRIDRVSKLTLSNLTTSGTGTVVEYGRIGLGTIADVNFPLPDVQLDRTLSHEGKRRTSGYTTQNVGIYPGLDRMGRPTRQVWADGALTTHGSSSTLPSRPPIVEETYSYDAGGNRTNKVDARPGAAWNNRDFQFDYDGLDRLKEAERGTLSGTTMTRGPGWMKWDLDMLGNWDVWKTDLDGNGTYTSNNETDTRTHNSSNELTQRSIPGASGTPLTLAYDLNGNLKSQKQSSLITRLQIHDAWNRLVEVQSSILPPVTIGYYEYNGLHWRTLKKCDTGGLTGLDQQREIIYSASWQPIEEEIDNYTNGGSPNGVDARAQEIWGMQYEDDAVLRRIDSNVDGDYTDSGDGTFFHLTDAQFSTVAMIDKAGVLIERVAYTAYGVATHHWAGDTDNNGSATTADRNAINALTGSGGTAITASGYDVACDLNRDGSITTADLTAWDGPGAKSALSAGLISTTVGSGSTDNQFGFDGYLFNVETKACLARFRWYEPVLGRWWEKDPLGEAFTGPNLYEFVAGRPTEFLDPSGLQIRWAADPYPLWEERQAKKEAAASAECDCLMAQIEAASKNGAVGLGLQLEEIGKLREAYNTEVIALAARADLEAKAMKQARRELTIKYNKLLKDRYLKLGEEWTEHVLRNSQCYANAGQGTNCNASKTNGTVTLYGRFARVGGVLVIVVAIGTDVYEIALSPEEERLFLTIRAGGRWAGASAGGWVGAYLGAHFGPVGGVIGGILGGIAGGIGGDKAGKAVTDAAKECARREADPDTWVSW